MFVSGSTALMARAGAEMQDVRPDGTTVFVCKAAKKDEADPGTGENSAHGVRAEYLGSVSLSDAPKPGAKKAVEELRKLGVGRIVCLTGDREAAAKKTCSELGIKEYYAELLPGDKVDMVEKIMSREGGSQGSGRGSGRGNARGRTVFVGDGINDAPALVRSDVGAAMGSFGSQAAIEAADMVILSDDPRAVADAVNISRKTSRTAKQNIIFSIAVKAAVLIVTATGLLGDLAMPVAVFADVGVMVLAVGNSMRLLKK